MRTALSSSDIKGRPPFVVVQPVEWADPDLDRSCGVDEDFQAVPAFAQTDQWPSRLR